MNDDNETLHAVPITPSDEITPTDKLDEKDLPQHIEQVDSEMRRKLVEAYGRHAETDDVAPAADISIILDRILEMSDEEATKILVKAARDFADDPNFPTAMLSKIHNLLRGSKVADMDALDWSFELRSIAAMIHYHSPYPEVRSVTDPHDDSNIPVETFRCYVLGKCLMGGSSALNTFFSPRQPSINLSGLVLQCILAPLGQGMAKVLPDWHLRLGNWNFVLNPGPWTYKEQIFATIMISVGNSAGGTYYTYLVQMLPQYLDQTWVNFGYEILLAIYAQMAGLGMAGLLRRFLIYPPAAIWPSVLPTLALNRALVVREKQGENVHGWTLSRYKFFMIAFVLMFVWFWIPNTFFTALHGFNWMTWIAPNNRNLATITGFYGGLGFNPWATFDWNVAGTGALVTPWFSAVQFYAGEVISGVIIICMYYANYAWAQYMPINSNETFNNQGQQYNISKVMGDNGYIDVAKYKEYGPPYYGGANVFGQGNLPAWYFMTLSYVTVRYWQIIRNSAVSVWKAATSTSPEETSDVHCRMMRAYPEVPDWWYLTIMVTSTACGIAAISAFPTHTPWWSIIVVIIISLLFLIPTSLITAITNKGIGLDILFKILSGTWFPGNPMALLILESIGPAFDAQADTFVGQLKIGHYAKVPPRAVFRGMVLSVLINAFIFIGVLNWMVHSYDNGTLCTWSNVQHFTCPTAVQDFTSAVMYGIYGTRNMYAMYPEIGWAMFLGLFIGTTTAICQKYGYVVPQYARRLREDRYEKLDRWVFRPLSKLEWFNPSVVWAGACATWTGGGNLSYHTNNLYIAFVFMFIIKRRYPAWWEKYNYLLEAGFDIGVAVSGTVQTLTFAFSGAHFPSWWGNTIATAGVDFQMYNQKDALLPIPEVGYFGLAPDQYPLHYPQSLLDAS